MRTIQLTRGKETLVSDIDYFYLIQWKWFVTTNGYAAKKYFGKYAWLNPI